MNYLNLLYMFLLSDGTQMFNKEYLKSLETIKELIVCTGK